MAVPRWLTVPVGQAARTVGRTYDYATPGAGTSTLTNAGRAIVDPNLVYTGGGVDGQASFKPANTGGGGSQTASSGQSTDSQVLGAYTEDDGSASSNAYTLASLAAQEGQLRDFLSGAGGQLDQGVTSINDDATSLRNKNNESRSRALEDFDTKTQDTERAKGDSLDHIDTSARVQANSLRNLIGRASGSGSSAYQITAPGAVARNASIDRQGVQEDFGANFRDLTTAKQRADEDYTSADADITKQANDKVKALKEGVLTSENDATASLADIARQKAAIQGGNPMTAGNTYDADIAGRRAAINSLFDQYRTPIQAQAVSVDTPTLRDYVTGDNTVTTDQGDGTSPAGTSPYSSFLKKRDAEFAY